MFCICISNCLEPVPYLSVSSIIRNPAPGPCLWLSAPFCHESLFQSSAAPWVAADPTGQEHSMERKLHCYCISCAGNFPLHILQKSEESGNYLCCKGPWVEGKDREGSYSKVSAIFQYAVWIMTQSPLKPMETLAVLSVFFGLNFRWAEMIEQVIFPKPGGTIQYCP